MNKSLTLSLLCFFLSGCLAGPPLDTNLPMEVKVWKEPLEASDSNKYAVLMNSNLYDKNGKFLFDPYVATDMSQIAKLLTHKGYTIWLPSNLKDLYLCFDNIAQVSNKETKTFFGYSGKGDSRGLRLIGQFISDQQNQLIIPPNATITPKAIFSSLANISGKKALLINACEAGVFTEDTENLDGVVITACPVGTETTPYELDNTSALYSTFLRYYSNIDTVHDLEQLDITTVGGWWYNLLHKVFTKSSKGISYDSVIYRGGSFKL